MKTPVIARDGREKEIVEIKYSVIVLKSYTRLTPCPKGKYCNLFFLRILRINTYMHRIICIIWTLSVYVVLDSLMHNY